MPTSCNPSPSHKRRASGDAGEHDPKRSRTHGHGKSVWFPRYGVGVPPLVGTKYNHVRHTMNRYSQKFEELFLEYLYISHENFR